MDPPKVESIDKTDDRSCGRSESSPPFEEDHKHKAVDQCCSWLYECMECCFKNIFCSDDDDDCYSRRCCDS
ncbi:unnamed protein product [Cuscuta campestris]|uniref:Uncharacterized protein n=1 Tax=Cuscuta campestris TaxID=132261 RepID=A0A484N518_9ASTE|nr:unnamed protein product [Cuscuta campestris]